MHVCAICESIHIKFDGPRKVAVQQNGAVTGHHDRFRDVTFQIGLIAYNFHRATTQNIGRTDHQRKADVIGDCQSFFVRMRDAVMRLFQPKIDHQLLKAFTVFGQIDGIRSGPKNWNASRFEVIGQLQRGLPTKLNDDTMQCAVILLFGQDFHHMFKSQRFKIKPI